MDAKPHPLICTSGCCRKGGLMIQWAALRSSSSASYLSLLGHGWFCLQLELPWWQPAPHITGSVLGMAPVPGRMAPIDLICFLVWVFFFFVCVTAGQIFFLMLAIPPPFRVFLLPKIYFCFLATTSALLRERSWGVSGDHMLLHAIPWSSLNTGCL